MTVKAVELNIHTLIDLQESCCRPYPHFISTVITEVTLTIGPNDIACAPKSLYFGESDSLSTISVLHVALADSSREIRDWYVFRCAHRDEE